MGEDDVCPVIFSFVGQCFFLLLSIFFENDAYREMWIGGNPKPVSLFGYVLGLQMQNLG